MKKTSYPHYIWAVFLVTVIACVVAYSLYVNKLDPDLKVQVVEGESYIQKEKVKEKIIAKADWKKTEVLVVPKNSMAAVLFPDGKLHLLKEGEIRWVDLKTTQGQKTYVFQEIGSNETFGYTASSGWQEATAALLGFAPSLNSNTLKPETKGVLGISEARNSSAKEQEYEQFTSCMQGLKTTQYSQRLNICLQAQNLRSLKELE